MKSRLSEADEEMLRIAAAEVRAARAKTSSSTGEEPVPDGRSALVEELLDTLEQVMWTNAVRRADAHYYPVGCLSCGGDPRGIRPCACQRGWALLKRMGRVKDGDRRAVASFANMGRRQIV